MQGKSSTLLGWVVDYCYQCLQGAFPVETGMSCQKGRDAVWGVMGRGGTQKTLRQALLRSCCTPVPAGAEGKPCDYLQALDLCPLELQPGLQLTDFGLLPAHQ